jgi:hypothetical protein
MWNTTADSQSAPRWKQQQKQWSWPPLAVDEPLR